MSKKKKEFKRFDNMFTYDELHGKLSGLTQSQAYQFTKRNDKDKFEQLGSLLPPNYWGDRKNDIESIDLIYSGSTGSPMQLTLAVGRNDRFRGKEAYDLDVFNIAPNTGNTASYFEHQWHHFKDENVERISIELATYSITGEERRKDLTYATYLTGSTYYESFEEYKNEKPEYFDIHLKSFKNLK